MPAIKWATTSLASTLAGCSTVNLKRYKAEFLILRNWRSPQIRTDLAAPEVLEKQIVRRKRRKVLEVGEGGLGAQ